MTEHYAKRMYDPGNKVNEHHTLKIETGRR